MALRHEIQNMFTLAIDKMEHATRELENGRHSAVAMFDAESSFAVEEDDAFSAILELEDGKVSEARNLLEASLNINLLCVMLPDVLEPVMCDNLVELLDEELVNFIAVIVKLARENVVRIRSAQEDAIQTRKKLEALKGKLVRVINVCQQVRSWWNKPFKDFEMNLRQLVELNGGIDAIIEEFSRKAKQEVAEFAQYCQRARRQLL